MDITDCVELEWDRKRGQMTVQPTNSACTECGEKLTAEADGSFEGHLFVHPCECSKSENKEEVK